MGVRIPPNVTDWKTVGVLSRRLGLPTGLSDNATKVEVRSRIRAFVDILYYGNVSRAEQKALSDEGREPAARGHVTVSGRVIRVLRTHKSIHSKKYTWRMLLVDEHENRYWVVIPRNLKRAMTQQGIPLEGKELWVTANWRAPEGSHEMPHFALGDNPHGGFVKPETPKVEFSSEALLTDASAGSTLEVVTDED